MGGIVIFLAMIIVAIARPKIMTTDIIIVLALALALFITGIYDDLKDLRARTKLYIQIVTASIIVFYGIRVEGLQIIGIESFGWPLSALISILCIVFFINAFNFIDGIDGLAGGLSIIAFSAFSALFYFAHAYDFAFLSAALAGSCLGFLFFNFSPARIFMGDTGTLTIGFFLAVFAIRATQLPEIIIFDTIKINSFYVAFTLVFLPSLDAARVFAGRLIKGFSPFMPDRTHIHHLLIDAGMTHKSVSLVFYSLQLTILSFAILPQSSIAMGIVIGALFLLAIVYEFVHISNYRKRFIPTIAKIRNDNNKSVLNHRVMDDIPEMTYNGEKVTLIEKRKAIEIAQNKSDSVIKSENIYASSK
jgi:UDP-N-acetylmuramyl pentapeptide phosphotransferase/UDP-N-acetylglucosamine-1-phosphate transferase